MKDVSNFFRNDEIISEQRMFQIFSLIFEEFFSKFKVFRKLQDTIARFDPPRLVYDYLEFIFP